MATKGRTKVKSPSLDNCKLLFKQKDQDGNRITRDSEEFKACVAANKKETDDNRSKVAAYLKANPGTKLN